MAFYQLFGSLFFWLIPSAALAAQAAQAPKLMTQPSLSASSIVFCHGGDLWTVERSGGRARRLTAGPGLELSPHYSPDGGQIAFTGEYDGNLDVYVVPAAGGLPRRLTYHPGPDMALGWSPDGERVLLRSGRDSHARFTRLFSVPLGGGLPEALPLPMAVQGALSADQRRIAYVPYWNRRGVPGASIAWKGYRGGKTSPIWIATLKDSSIEAIPRSNSNDSDPMWVQDRILFLSDREGSVELYAYALKDRSVRRLSEKAQDDISSASAGPGAIVYERFGAIFLFDLASGQSRKVQIEVGGDLGGAMPRVVEVGHEIARAGLSPSGVRALFEARGDIWSLPAEKGDARNLTRSSAAAERDPAWSPDGKTIAFLSDAGGEYALHLLAQDGRGQVRRIDLGRPPSFYYRPLWSPDGKRIALHDKRLNLWVVDPMSGRKTLIDTDTYDSPFRSLDPAWSPDSRYLAYSKQEPSQLRAIWVHDTRKGKSQRLTDGMSDARHAVFTPDGKHLAFLASTDSAPTLGWIDLSSTHRPVTSSVWVVVLSADDPSPLEPLSDEEGQGDKTDEKKPGVLSPAPRVKIDFEGISRRSLALPLEAKNYVGLHAAKTGSLFLLEAGLVPDWTPANMKVLRFDFDKRKAETYLEGVDDFVLSADGEKTLFLKDKQWFICGSDKPPQPGEGKLDLSGMRVKIEPRLEWGQMYDEVWRIQRDFLYDPGAHGLDLEKTAARYRPYLSGLRHRHELNLLFGEMLGHLVLGHTYVAGGDCGRPSEAQGGLLGADYVVQAGRYRFARIYDGENWNPKLKAPLTRPGAQVRSGEYLLAVEGRPLSAAGNPHRALENTAGRMIRLTVGPRADGRGSRELDVVPIADETGLRHRAWVEDMRRMVERLSQGKLGYVYLPNTAADGYSSFNRDYFAQVGKQGMVLDERFNGGGLAADYIIDHLRRPLLNYWTTREGADFRTPAGAVLGPKAMIINESAGSGGDALPWYFRRLGLGELIGTRTWGGLVGIYDYPQLLDGGRVTAPRMAFWSPDGEWDVENRGVAPDIEVLFDPAAWRQGRDPQLEKAVEVLLERIERDKPPQHKRPDYPRVHRRE